MSSEKPVKKPDPAQIRRMQEIEQAAQDLLGETGYKATSMLAIARRAKASNETLYRWYGSKQTLFLRMIERNAAGARDALQSALGGQQNLEQTLDQLGPLLLSLVLGDRAVVLNRAAAAEAHASTDLGRALSTGGRQTIETLLTQVISRTTISNAPDALCANEAAGAYLDLLIGDLQLRRINGALTPLPAEDIQQRAERAKKMLLILIGASAD